MRILWGIFRRLIFLFVFSFICLNTVLLVVLNSAKVQTLVVESLNASLFKSFDLEAKVNFISVNFFTSTIRFKNVQIYSTKNGTKTGPFKVFEVSSIGIGVEPVLSYIRRKPVIYEVVLDGLNLNLKYDDLGNLVFPFQFSSSKAIEPVNLKKIIHLISKEFPKKLSLKNAKIKFGEISDKNFQSFNIDEIVLQSASEKNSIAQFFVSSRFSGGIFRFPKLHSEEIQLQELSSQIHLAETGEILLSKINLESSLGKADFGGSVKLNLDDISQSSFDLRIKTDIKFDKVMPLVGLSGAGEISFAGKLESKKGILQMPVAQGKLNWKSLKIDSFDVYEGIAEASFKDLSIEAKKIEIKTPLGGQLNGEGQFSLKNDFPFDLNVNISRFGFGELMKGLGAAQNIAQFNVDALDADVSGRMIAPGKKLFELKVSTNATVSGLIIPPLHNEKAKPLPECRVALELYASAEEVNFNETSGECDGKKIALVDVPKGYIKFNKSHDTYFEINAQDFDMSYLEYFLGFPTAGMGNLKGLLAGSQSKILQFDADIDATNVLLYGVKYRTLKGKLGVNGERAFGKNVLGTAQIAGSDKVTSINLKRFSVAYKNVDSLFEGTLFGDLEPMRDALETYIPKNFPDFGGKIGQVNVFLQGPLMSPKKWELNSAVLLGDSFIGQLQTKDVKIRLNCKLENCFNSQVIATGLSNHMQKNALNGSVLVADIAAFNQKNVLGRAKLTSFPLSVFSGNNQNFDGALSVDLDISGSWEKWSGSVRSYVDSFKFNDLALGNFSFDAVTHDGGDINGVLQGRYQQLYSRLRMPHNLSSEATLYTRFSGFDAGFLIEPAKRAKQSVFLQVDGEATLVGPGPLNPSLKTGKNWYDLYSINGSIDRINAQFNQVYLKLDQQVKFSTESSIFNLKPLQLRGSKTEFLLDGKFDFENFETDALLVGKVDFGILSAFTDRVSAASGEINGKMKVTGVYPDLKVSGNADISGDSLNIKEYSPAFTGIKGSIIFEDDNLEIRNFHAEKGQGSVDLVGSVGWNFDSTSGVSNGLKLALKLEANDAQIRIPIPVIDALDTTIDGSLELTGDDFPYSLSGQIQLKKARGYKDITCQQAVFATPERREHELVREQKPLANLAISIDADESIVLQTECLKGKMSTYLKVTGNTNVPVFSGMQVVNVGTVQFLKSKFEIQKADITYDNPIRIDPRLEVQLMAKIDNYKVFISIDGFFSQRRVSFWADPAVTPEGDTLNSSDILGMISSGKAPVRGERQSMGSSILSQAVGMAYTSTAIDESLSLAFARITGGFIDSVQIQPLMENGQVKLKARVSRSLGERLNLGLDLDQGNNQTLTGTVLLNEGVNLLGGFERRSEGEAYSEYTGGLRFQFGSR